MRYKLLGRSGLRVSELCLGAMTFGEEWGWGASKDESRRIFDAYVERGGNFVDTANRYTDGTSEKWVGEMIAAERASFVLATKYTLAMHPEDPSWAGNHRKNMVQALEASLKRLGTDYVDLYWLHAWDYLTPIDEVMRAFDDLVRAGKILYAGISDAPAWIVSASNVMADLRGWTPFVGLQIEYSLIERTVERELLPMARHFDLAVLAWSPLGSGLLTGKYARLEDGGKKGQRLSAGSRRLTERNLAIARETKAVAEQLGCTSAQVAINWLRAKPGVVIPMLGARSVAQMEENLAALDVSLPADAVARLDAASAIEHGFPHEFLGLDSIKDIVWGKRRTLIDPHGARGDVPLK
jgi:aryl-alcohol dehydrogenase-like predicted oxidoreductase